MFVDLNGRVTLDGSAVHNGQGMGIAGQFLTGVHWDPGMARPFIDQKGEKCVILNKGTQRTDDKTGERLWTKQKVRVADLMARGVYHPSFLVSNALTLTRDAHIQMDKRIERATRQRLRAWADLSARNSRGGFDAMAKTTLEYHAMTDPGEARVDMDAIVDGRRDRPAFLLRSVPLPITHSDFHFSQREVAVSRSSGAPLDTTMAEAAARRVGELIEQTLIGTVTGLTYGTVTTGPGTHTGTSTVYGYTNFPYRVTKTDLTTPLGTNPEATVQDILEMRETMRTNGFFGPYVVYHSTSYDLFLDNDYFRTGGTSVTRTLRERVMAIEDISSFIRLDYLTSGYQLVMVDMGSGVVEAINGMDVTTVFWETKGGLELNYKVMAIQVPLLKAPYNGVAGIIHGTTS